MMFVLSISLLLLSFIQYGYCARTASAVLYQDDSTQIGGYLTIYQDNAAAVVMVNGVVFGLNSSTVHGFHVHTNGISETLPNCSAAGGHFNPYNVSHGPPTANLTGRHVGDLGNITTDTNGVAYINITDSIIQLYNITQSIISRTFVVHAMFDDGGYTNMNESNVTGNAGARLLCGLIKLTSDTTSTTTTTTTTTTTMSATTSSMALSTLKSTSWFLLITLIFTYFFFY